MFILSRARQYLLYGLFLSLPLERIPSLDVALGGTTATVRISQVLGLVLIILSTPILWRNRRQLLQAPWRWLVLFNVITWASIGVSHDPGRAMVVAVYIGFVSVLAWTIASVIDPQLLKRYRWWLLVAAIGSCLFGLFQYFGDLAGLSTVFTGLRDRYTRAVFGFPRIQSTALEPLYFADYLLIPLALTCVYAVRNARYFWLCTSFFAIIFMTVSRGAYVAAILVALTVAVYAYIEKRLMRGVTILGSLALGIGIAVGLIALGGKVGVTHSSSGAQVHQFTQQSTNISEGDSVEGRTATRRLAIQAFKHHPVLGLGVGNFGQYAHTMMPASYSDNRAIVNNEPLEILAEEGILGLIALILFVVSMGTVAFKRYRSESNFDKKLWIVSFFIALLAIAAQYQTFSTLYITYIWVAIGVLIGLSRHETRVS